MNVLAFLLFTMLTPGTSRLGDFNSVGEQAAKEHRLILVNFSGSDWCSTCMRLRTGTLGSQSFQPYAAEHLVLVRADFPQQKKNQLPADQVKRNQALADQCNAEGKFACTSLLDEQKLDEQKKVLRSWDGYPGGTIEQFTAQIDDKLNSIR